jgi:hypothetical protein
MNEFHDKDTVIQDKANLPTKGPSANIEWEKQFLNGVREFNGFTVTGGGAEDNVTFYESNMDFVATNGQGVHLEQISVTKWKNGKIVHECFYYATDKKA